MAKTERECPCCGNVRTPTAHHIIPRKLWKNRQDTIDIRHWYANHVYLLCWPCHEELNRLILRAEDFYLRVKQQIALSEKRKTAVLFEQHVHIYRAALAGFIAHKRSQRLAPYMDELATLPI